MHRSSALAQLRSQTQHVLSTKAMVKCTQAPNSKLPRSTFSIKFVPPRMKFWETTGDKRDA